MSAPLTVGPASLGTRWSQAVTPTPLTLPAHASLLTGLVPPEHGLRDNGTAVLPKDVPTLARLAAETNVDRSIDHAEDFVLTDTYGVWVLLEEARRAKVRRSASDGSW